MSIKSILASAVAKNIKKKLINSTINEEDISELLKEIRIALLNADVNLLVVKDFIKNIKKEAVGRPIETNEDPQQVMLTIIKSELIKILGEYKPIDDTKKPLKIFLVGLQGSGKTTTAAKLANYFKTKKNKKPLLVALDIYRPAAIEQLKDLSKQINVDIFEKGQQDPTITAIEALEYAKVNKHDVLIFDTAGRLQTDEKLMDELKAINKSISPTEKLFVVDAMAGQDIYNVIHEFNNALSLSGIIITKLDSEARAGVSLSISYLLKLPIKFTGTGERIGSLDVFYPDRMADRILGLGDILTLAEKASEVVDETKVKRTFYRILSGKMDLEDLLIQIQQTTKIGSIKSIASMIPGLSGKIDDAKTEMIEEKIRVWQILLNSMTKKERREPKLLRRSESRRNRIVKGSGRKPDELNKFLNEYDKTKQKMDEIGKKIRSGMNPFKNFI